MADLLVLGATGKPRSTETSHPEAIPVLMLKFFDISIYRLKRLHRSPDHSISLLSPRAVFFFLRPWCTLAVETCAAQARAWA